MPNHFHALIRIKHEEEFRSKAINLLGLQDSASLDLTGLRGSVLNLSGLISKTFSNFFNAYAKAYNKMYNRRGSLFNRPFKTKEIDSDAYLTAVITYIHRNPIYHGFCEKPNDWPFSSYDALLSTKPTKLKRAEVIEWFGDVDAVEKSHRYEVPIPDKTLLIDF